MIHGNRIRAAMKQGVEAGLTGDALERYISQRIGLDQVDDFATVHRIADEYKRIVWPTTRRKAGSTTDSPSLF